jgi:hypothetical protein
MNGASTVLMKPTKQRTGNDNEDIKQFSFDHSYWSFSNDDPHYADQQAVFNDLGVEVLKNAWEGMRVQILTITFFEQSRTCTSHLFA